MVRLQKGLPLSCALETNVGGGRRQMGLDGTPKALLMIPPPNPGCPPRAPMKPLPSCPPSHLNAASPSPTSPAQSCIQVVCVARAPEIIPTSSPSSAELPGLCRRSWS